MALRRARHIGRSSRKFDPMVRQKLRPKSGVHSSLKVLLTHQNESKSGVGWETQAANPLVESSIPLQSNKTARRRQFLPALPDCTLENHVRSSTMCCRRHDGHDAQLAHFLHRNWSSCYTCDRPRPRESKPSHPPWTRSKCRAHSGCLRHH